MGLSAIHMNVSADDKANNKVTPTRKDPRNSPSVFEGKIAVLPW